MTSEKYRSFCSLGAIYSGDGILKRKILLSLHCAAVVRSQVARLSIVLQEAETCPQAP